MREWGGKVGQEDMDEGFFNMFGFGGGGVRKWTEGDIAMFPESADCLL